ncbi:MAG: DUF421 domain-containing protein [Bacilli bacterium]|nr:DUF421 domain-containing protein [Bacilli bacterium]
MLETILKTLFLYFFIVLLYRIMGKKEVGQLGIMDLIVWVLIAELAALSLEEPKNSLWLSVVPIVTLFCIQIVLSFISIKSTKVRRFMDGRPTVIIKNGKLMFREMSKLRYSLDDLISQLREQGIKSIDEVNFAVLENNGKLSVFETGNDYPMPLILDGVIDYYVLKEIRKSETWLMNLLKKRNIPLDDVFYAFYTRQKTFIIKKSDL